MARPNKEVLEERQNFLQTIADCADKPSKFSEVFLNHKLFPYNKEYVDCNDRFIVYRSGRQVGKTMSTAVKAIHFAFFAPLMLKTVNTDCTIVIAAPTQNQATIMFGRIRDMILRNDFCEKLNYKIIKHPFKKLSFENTRRREKSIFSTTQNIGLGLPPPKQLASPKAQKDNNYIWDYYSQGSTDLLVKKIY